MSIAIYIQRKFNMAIFKYISRFEDLLEQVKPRYNAITEAIIASISDIYKITVS